MKFNSRFLVAVYLVLTLLLSLWLRPAIASSSLNDSRINQLEYQVRSLQTQVNQLQGRSPNQSSTNATARPEIGTTLNEPSLDEQFDNLATLVIEINQRVIKLEEEISSRSN